MYSRAFRISDLQKNYRLFQSSLSSYNLNEPNYRRHEQKSISTKENPTRVITLFNSIKSSFFHQKQIRTMTNNINNLNIHTINTNDVTEVLKFLKTNFFVDEPITEYLKLMDNPKSVAALSKHSMKSIVQNISFLAKSGDGEIAGVCLNSIKRRNDTESEEEKDPIFGKISRLLGFVDREAKVFDMFPDVDRVLSVDIISVDGKLKGQGIAKNLMDRTRDLARKQGIKLIRVDCTSHFSARASARLGMECVYELKYADYKENGVQVFNPEPPHTEVKVYVQRLDR